MAKLKLLMLNKRAIILIILSVFFVLLFSFIFLPNVVLSNELKQNLNKNDAIGIAITTNGGLENTYRDFNYGLRLYKTCESNILTNPIKTKTIQELDVTYDNLAYINKDTVLYGNYSRLKTKEIAISRFVSENNHLNIGDFLYFNDGHNVNSFKIKYIYNEVASFYGININNVNGSILLPFGTNVNDINFTYIHCLSSEDHGTYSDIFYKKNDLATLDRVINIYFWVFILLILIVLFIMAYLLYIFVKKSLYKLKIYGLSTFGVLSVFSLNYMVSILIPILSAAIIYYLVSGILISIYVSLIIGILLYLVMLSFIGEKIKGGHYGK